MRRRAPVLREHQGRRDEEFGAHAFSIQMSFQFLDQPIREALDGPRQSEAEPVRRGHCVARALCPHHSAEEAAQRSHTTTRHSTNAATVRPVARSSPSVSTRRTGANNTRPAHKNVAKRRSEQNTRKNSRALAQRAAATRYARGSCQLVDARLLVGRCPAQPRARGADRRMTCQPQQSVGHARRWTRSFLMVAKKPSATALS